MSAQELIDKAEALAAKLDADVHRLWAEFEECVAKELEKAEGKDEAGADTKTDATAEQPPAGQTSTGASVSEPETAGSSTETTEVAGQVSTEPTDAGASTGTETGISAGASAETAGTETTGTGAAS